MFTKRQAALLYTAGALSMAFAAAVISLELRPAPKELARYNELPPFTLTNQDGKAVTRDDFKGKVWLADFVYTTCPGPCPMITAHMAHLQGLLPQGRGVALASFSTDPKNDTPAVLKAYAAKYGAGERWTFLTGAPAQEYDLINHGFMLAASAPPGAPILHSTKMALVDKTGTVRAYYDGSTEAGDAEILADVQRLLEE